MSEITKELRNKVETENESRPERDIEQYCFRFIFTQ